MFVEDQKKIEGKEENLKPKEKIPKKKKTEKYLQEKF